MVNINHLLVYRYIKSIAWNGKIKFIVRHSKNLRLILSIFLWYIECTDKSNFQAAKQDQRWWKAILPSCKTFYSVWRRHPHSCLSFLFPISFIFPPKISVNLCLYLILLTGLEGRMNFCRKIWHSPTFPALFSITFPP